MMHVTFFFPTQGLQYCIMNKKFCSHVYNTAINTTESNMRQIIFIYISIFRTQFRGLHGEFFFVFCFFFLMFQNVTTSLYVEY